MSTAEQQRRAAYQKRWYANNRDAVLAWRKKWNQEHPGHSKAYNALWRAENLERARAHARGSYARNAEKCIGRIREWQIKNPDRVRATQRAASKRYAIAHPDRVTEAKRKWNRENPERCRLYANKRRALKVGAQGKCTVKEWREKLRSFGGCCAYCRGGGPMAQDHVVPLSRGGSNDISNIVPACKRCNSRKGTRTAEEFSQHFAEV